MIRNIELNFVRKWMGDPPKRVLDVGCGEAFPYPRSWCNEGFKMWGIDCRPCCEDPFFLVEDCRHMSFPDQSFDVVFSVSSVEHVGIGRYGDEYDQRFGDIDTIREMTRVLRDDGVVTLPAGYVDAPTLHRLYNPPRLTKLFEGLQVLEMHWYVQRGGWYPSTPEQIRQIVGNSNEWIANVNVALQK